MLLPANLQFRTAQLIILQYSTLLSSQNWDGGNASSFHVNDYIIHLTYFLLNGNTLGTVLTLSKAYQISQWQPCFQTNHVWHGKSVTYYQTNATYKFWRNCFRDTSYLNVTVTTTELHSLFQSHVLYNVNQISAHFLFGIFAVNSSTMLRINKYEKIYLKTNSDQFVDSRVGRCLPKWHMTMSTVKHCNGQWHGEHSINI